HLEGGQELYDQYRFDEPWDGPNNSKLLTKMPKVFELPGDTTAPPGHTYYQVFVSPPRAREPAIFSTAPAARPLLSEIPDGPEETILIAEAATPVPWTKPADITFPAFGAPAVGKHYSGFNAACADGTVHFIRGNIRTNSLRALITRDAGDFSLDLDD